ncbi:unnamed protein product [Chironomus riparius]|uniref:C2H2-type domain-containing protein n=1 Tax=Chironomus riparius TaxID=315576 RepID=A0A9N9WUY4_9DIPT|nr:unnamed protein product [Chironomus riparius]
MSTLQGQQQNFNNAVFVNPNNQIRQVFTFSPNVNQKRSTTNINGYDSTPRKRKHVSDNNEADQADNSGKRQHIEAQTNSHHQSIYTCFNNNCQHRSFSNESFSKLLNFFQNDQRNVLKGFCMNCGSSIFEELFHLYEHFRGFSQSCEQANVEIRNVPSNDFVKPFIIKKEAVDILEQTDFIDQFEKTNVSDMELDDSITGREVHENTPNNVELSPVAKSTQAPNQNNVDETSFNIKKEAIERHHDLEATVRMPEPKKSVSNKFEDLNATVLIPYDQHRLIQSIEPKENLVPNSEKLCSSKLTCLDFISKKIDNAKNNESDKKKNITPNKKSIFNLKKKSSTEVKNVEPKEPEDVDMSLNNITIDNLLERIKNSTKTVKEGPKFVIEVEDLDKGNDKNKKTEKESQKSEEAKTKSKQRSSINNYFSKIDGTKKFSKSEACSEFQSNFSEQLMTKVMTEKTPIKGTPKRKESLRNRNESEKQSINKETEINNIAAVNLEQVHPKYQTKLASNEDKSTKSETKLIKQSDKADKKSSNLNNSSTSHDKSLNNSQKSLNNSQKTLNSTTFEMTKHVPYMVDIEALIAKSSSNAELVSIKDLYPWINQSVTSIMFKTKPSIDILLNEYSLFSTYKCMNEFCNFFTTDFEEFKTHAKSHDSINNYCSYCLKNFDKSIDLCNHLDISHKFDRFQCNKCMFRSCQKGYVDVHQRVHHADKENCEVFKSPVQKLLKSDRSKCLPALNKNREKFVMPYRCKTPRCREVFYCKDNYRKHLEMESQKPSCKDFMALICHQLTLIDHSRTTTNAEGVYQCLHCSYGTDSSNIFDHMALNHPHEFAYVCKRVKPQRLVELNIISAHETVENSTSIEYFGTTTAEAKSFKGDLEKLNFKNLGKELKGKKRFVVSDVMSIDN